MANDNLVRVLDSYAIGLRDYLAAKRKTVTAVVAVVFAAACATYFMFGVTFNGKQLAANGTKQNEEKMEIM